MADQDNLVEPTSNTSQNSSSTDGQQPTPQLQAPVMTPVHVDPPKSTPKFSRKNLLLIMFLIVALIIAGLGTFIYFNKHQSSQQNTVSNESKHGSLVTGIKNRADFVKLNEDQQKAFCKDLLSYKADAPEVKAVHQRLGLSGVTNEDMYLWCKTTGSVEPFVSRDLSGYNDAQAKRIKQEGNDIAKTFTFDTYDATFTTNDLELSKRIAMAIEGEAKNMLIEYTTLTNNGFGPNSSTAPVRIQLFDIRDFPKYTNNCGPQLMRIEWANFDNSRSCEKTSETLLGMIIYKGKGVSISSDSYNVTINNTRIMVEARNEKEAIGVLRSMKKVPFDQLDFFLKN